MLFRLLWPPLVAPKKKQQASRNFSPSKRCQFPTIRSGVLQKSGTPLQEVPNVEIKIPIFYFDKDVHPKWDLMDNPIGSMFGMFGMAHAIWDFQANHGAPFGSR